MTKIFFIALAGVAGLFWLWKANQAPLPAAPPTEETVSAVDLSKAPRAVIDPFVGLSGAARKPGDAIERLAFSNTMRLGEEFRAFLAVPAPTLGAKEREIR